MIDLLAGYVIWAILITLFVLAASLGLCILAGCIEAMIKAWRLRRRR